MIKSSYVAFFLLMVIVICNGCNESRSGSDTHQRQGQIKFTLTWPTDDRSKSSNVSPASESINCGDYGVTVVSCHVYDQSGTTLASGAWPCENKKGTLGKVPAKEGLTIVLRAKDAQENTLYRGVREDVAVAAGQTNDLGIIELVTVDNSPPTALIDSPQTDAVIQEGASVTFEGSAEDPEEGAIDDAGLIWSSNIDGQIGTGSRFEHSTLSAGTHEITLTATNSDGDQGQAQITLIINAAPNVTINNPVEGYGRCIGLAVNFSGSANDSEDGDMSDNGTLEWLSDRDGQIGTANQFSTDTLSQGPHTISFSATDSLGAQGTASVRIVVHPPRLADTGQTISTSIPGEDSDYTIYPPAFTDNQDGTVTDDLTGLMWQQNDDGIARPYYIANYEYAGTVSIGGHSDWRLPSKKELLRIVNYNRENPSIDHAYFPQTKDGCYWTQTLCDGQTEQGWSVDYTNGSVQPTLGFTPCYVRLVRRPLDTQPTDFEIGNDDTIIDHKTGLIWLSAHDEQSRSRSEAILYCERLTHAGYTDWRLPNIKELESIVDDTKYNPAIHTDLFRDTPSAGYWSSTVRAGNVGYYWKVDFTDGNINAHSVNEEPNHVRCVRNLE